MFYFKSERRGAKLIDEDRIRERLSQYVWQHTHPIMVAIDAKDRQCQDMVERIADAILASNAGLSAYIIEQIDRAPTKKKSAVWSTWKDRLRLLVVAYMEGLYHELDSVDVYLKVPGARIACDTVVGNKDRIVAACRKAYSIARERRKHLNGYHYFSAAA